MSNLSSLESTSQNSFPEEPQFRFGSFEPVYKSADSETHLSKNGHSSQKTILSAIFGLVVVILSFIYWFLTSLFEILFRSKAKPFSKSKSSSKLSRAKMSSSLKMEKIDLIVIASIVIGATTFLFRKFLFVNPKLRVNSIPKINADVSQAAKKSVSNEQRDIAKQMKLKNANIVLFYGSQTGTAEDYAKRLARELQQEYNARTLIIDPEKADIETLSKIHPKHVAIFVLAATGEGEPTDNLAPWYDSLIGSDDLFITDFSDLEPPSFHEPVDDSDFPPDFFFDEMNPLSNLTFTTFGLGNSTYEHFNSPAKQVTRRLKSLGARFIGTLGLGDDDIDIDDDFEKWKSASIPSVIDHIKSTIDATDSTSNMYEPGLIIKELDRDSVSDKLIGCVRPSVDDKQDDVQFKVDVKHPWYSLPTHSKLLTAEDCERRIIHLELDLEDGRVAYQTGDHVGVYPTNYESQVRLLLNLLKLDEAQPISLEPNPNSLEYSPFPQSVSTYGAVLRHYLDITTPIPKDSIKHILLPLAKSEPARNFLQKLIDDKEFYNEEVSSCVLSPGELIQRIQNTEKLESVPSDLQFSIPFSILTDLLPRLAARFYSISSSSTESSTKVSITAVVLRYEVADGITRYGIATNYIDCIHNALAGPESEKLESHTFTSNNLTYNLKNTKKHHSSNQLAVPIYIRKSNFHLPSSPLVPVVMVGPGTGIAPFRGFVRERAHLAKNNTQVGPTVLFFGNRNKDKDFLYKDELLDLFETLGAGNENSKLFTAFSRDQPKKVYVQHKMLENSGFIWDLLYNKKGHFYICGDGKQMSKDVVAALKEIAMKEGKMDDLEATEWLSNLKNSTRYAEDVWY
ncbi:hypothetical protein BB560_003210 [Smittium megazygosporum]|uniref:NADPH--hemoprotein reductase n=1 Tax=Smittium megazygosporum TaxID=133381 RepID=A0A2T9ZCL9_9FUNG|nr:hypothetical protein BB560_003210 [Smittium megazygosporum]